ncbi:MAG: hypothetical protein QXK48_03930 [Candidatus Aenigmatarchaeota archaeon]
MSSFKNQSMTSYTIFGDDFMKFLVFIFFLILFFTLVANSAIVEVNVPKSLEGNISSFSYDPSTDILKFQIEFYNTGSVSYKTRIRLDILNGSRIVFTGWSKENTLMPGDRKNFEIYWYTNSTGKFHARIRSYFGNEIFEKNFEIEKKNSYSPEDIFEIKNFRTYEDFIVFDIKAKNNVSDIVILPSEFPPGWIFEQKKINFLGENEERTVAISYYPTVWTEEKINLIVASDGGKYKSEESFEMKKESGIFWFVYYFMDKLKLFLRGI